MSDIDKDIERVKELQSTIYEGGDYIYLNKNDKQALENVLSELEIYKKIAEKLADSIVSDKKILSLTCKHIINKTEDECKEQNCLCDDCIIDWARKEVEK